MPEGGDRASVNERQIALLDFVGRDLLRERAHRGVVPGDHHCA